MATSRDDQNYLVPLVNELNLPYSIASTAETPAEVRAREGFARRLKLLETPRPLESWIDAARFAQAALLLETDQNNLLRYLGGSLTTIGDYTADLRDLAQRVARCVPSGLWFLTEQLEEFDPSRPLTEKESGYLAKATGVNRVSKWAVLYGKGTGGPLQRFATERPTSMVNCWAACAARATEDPRPTANMVAVLPEPLASLLAQDLEEKVLIDVTQLDQEDRAQVARNLAYELDEGMPLNEAVHRAFAA